MPRSGGLHRNAADKGAPVSGMAAARQRSGGDGMEPSWQGAPQRRGPLSGMLTEVTRCPGHFCVCCCLDAEGLRGAGGGGVKRGTDTGHGSETVRIERPRDWSAFGTFPPPTTYHRAYLPSTITLLQSNCIKCPGSDHAKPNRSRSAGSRHHGVEYRDRWQRHSRAASNRRRCR